MGTWVRGQGRHPPSTCDGHPLGATAIRFGYRSLMKPSLKSSRAMRPFSHSFASEPSVESSALPPASTPRCLTTPTNVASRARLSHHTSRTRVLDGSLGLAQCTHRSRFWCSNSSLEHSAFVTSVIDGIRARCTASTHACTQAHARLRARSHIHSLESASANARERDLSSAHGHTMRAVCLCARRIRIIGERAPHRTAGGRSLGPICYYSQGGL